MPRAQREFSEREFEFSFNLTFLRTQSGGVVVTPFIPSQRKEGHLGYDVRFDLSHAGRVRSVFFQHKVSAFAQYRRGKGTAYYDAHNGPYYHFPLRSAPVNQHALLVRLAYSGEQVYYTAPLFYQSAMLQSHATKDDILNESVFLDPLSLGFIPNGSKHKVSYSHDGRSVCLHSDMKPAQQPLRWEQIQTMGQTITIDDNYLSHLYHKLIEALSQAEDRRMEGRRRLARDEPLGSNPSQQIVDVLLKHFDLSWILIPES